MSIKLFIGGLSWNTDSESLRQGFEKFGPVEDAVVIRDRETGRSRGFGFVVYSNEDNADAAILEMNDREFEGRTIRVQKAEQRDSGRGGNPGGRSFGGNGGRRFAGSDYAPRDGQQSSAEGW
jgi:RNA recognition motif-containing protein